LHGDDAKREFEFELKIARVCQHRLQVQASGSARELRDQHRVIVERGDGMSGTGQRKRYAACSCADFEHRIAVPSCQREPQREILSIPAAFQVMPHH
jgi:hypothetical protein